MANSHIRLRSLSSSVIIGLIRRLSCYLVGLVTCIITEFLLIFYFFVTYVLFSYIFSEEAKILLSPSHLSVCVSSLQDVKLFNSNLDVVDDAFEYLMSKSSKGEKGQYFTPRYVIDMCVKMLNPKPDETMDDRNKNAKFDTKHSSLTKGVSQGSKGGRCD